MKRIIALLMIVLAMPLCAAGDDITTLEGELLELYKKRQETFAEALKTRMVMFELRKAAVADTKDLRSGLEPHRQKLRENRKTITELSKQIREKKTMLKQKLHNLRLKAQKEGKKERLIELEEVSDIE